MSWDNYIFHASGEFIYKRDGVHYDKGWYFLDEEEDLYGPFLSKKQCEVGLQLYIKQLMAGKSPTQWGMIFPDTEQ